jgi:hypothetical protein
MKRLRESAATEADMCIIGDGQEGETEILG